MMEKRNNESVKSYELRAGSRTYFFDVKETRSGEYYLVLTESKRARDGQDRKERHRLFLYREDMEAFMKNMQEATDLIFDKQPLNEEERRKFRNANIDDSTPPASEGGKELTFEDL